MDSTGLDFLNIASLPSKIANAAFKEFSRIYLLAFPLPDEQQNPEEWKENIYKKEATTAILLVGKGFKNLNTLEVWGGIVVEYYPNSACGLIAYIAVDKTKRGHGWGGKLMKDAFNFLVDLAEKKQQKLRGVFGEVEDIRHKEILAKDFAAKRLLIQHKFGARWIDIDYVMPRIDETKNRDEHLFLVTYPDLRVTLNPLTISLATVEDFLDEYYLGEEENPKDSRTDKNEVPRMKDQVRALSNGYHETFGRPLPDKPITDQPRDKLLVPLKALPRKADGWLSLSYVSFCFHMITEERKVNTKKGCEDLSLKEIRQFGFTNIDREPLKYICPVYRSFEADVLSYRFQKNSPIVSSCFLEEQKKVTICFPEEIVYTAEGLENRILQARKNIQVRISLTSSSFSETDIHIWHLAILPLFDPGSIVDEGLSELDIVRLISFYYREQEQMELLYKFDAQKKTFYPITTFQIEGDPEKLSFKGLLWKLSGGRLDADQPNAGTIELNPAFEAEEELMDTWENILSALYRTTEDDQEGFRDLKELYGSKLKNNDQPVKQLLDACCGIVSGHMDYVRMGYAEMQDTLAPDSSAGTYALWMNRATITSVDLQDKMLEQCGRTIGISPYLILPQAVLLHNDHIIDKAERKALEVLKKIQKDDGGLELEKQINILGTARKEIEEILYQKFIPNIFHYPSERELYEGGSKTRGAQEKKEMVERLFTDINAHLRDRNDQLQKFRDEAQDFGEKRRNFLITIVTLLLGFTVISDVIPFIDEVDMGKFWPPTWRTYIIGIAVIIIILICIIAFPQKKQEMSSQSKTT